MSVVPYKITDLMKMSEKLTFSYEIIPNATNKLDDIKFEPLFYSITWHASVHKCKDLDIAPLKLAKFLKRNNKNVLLHLSCHLLRKSFADSVLLVLQKEGIRNLFVILGEKYAEETSDFKSSQELIHFIRQKSGDYFCIGVAAFPEREDNLKHLKEKISSGADFIITQAVFDIKVFNDFLNKCKLLHITVPILPGIFAFETEEELTGFLNLCKVTVSEGLMEDFKNRSGIEILSKQVVDICMACDVKHFHFFTLNKIARTLKLIELLHKELI